MAPKISEDEIDDLLYFGRTGDKEEFETLREELCNREGCGILELLEVAMDAESGNAVLHMVCANGHSDLLKSLLKLLSTGAGIQSPQVLRLLSTQNSAGNTPLHWAALNGHLECVKGLLEGGADPTILNGRGHDAVFEAELNDRGEVVEWVLREGGEGLEVGLGPEGEGDGDEEMSEGGEDVEDVEEMEGEVEGKGNGKDLQAQLESAVEGMQIVSNGEGETEKK